MPSDESGSERDDEENREETGQYDDDDDDNANDNDSDDDQRSRIRRKSKSKSKSGARRYIDDAAEEEDDEGGVKAYDEDDDDDDDELDYNDGKSKNAFIVDDDEEEERPRERIRISESEKKATRDDLELVRENLNIDGDLDHADIAEDSDQDDEEGDGAPARKRIKRAQTSWKEQREYDDRPGRSDQPTYSRNYDDDSEDSMDDFIEDDEPAGQEQGVGKRRRKGARASVNDQEMDKIEKAVDLFGEDEYDEDYEEEAKTGNDKEEGPGFEKLYEPHLIKEYFLSREDDEIRKTDAPERLQIDLKKRGPTPTLAEVQDEAEWIVKQHARDVQFIDWKYLDDFGDDMVDVPVPVEDQEDDQPQFMKVTRSERARDLRSRLVSKISNVICFFRGVEKEDIHHTASHFFEGVPKWWETSTEEVEQPAMPESIIFDIPFIAHYRKEYWKPELREDDLWTIYDLDARYCILKQRKEQLKLNLEASNDTSTLHFLHKAFSMEELSDVKAFMELRSSENEEEQVETKGFKRPVKYSRYKVCKKAGIHKILDRCVLSPVKLAENLAGFKAHTPPDPAEDPVEFLLDYVEDAREFGFQDATALLAAVRFSAAKEIAADPVIRRYVREEYFERYATITCSETKQGEDSGETIHHEFRNYRQVQHRDIDDEDFLTIIKCKGEKYLNVDIKMDPRSHDRLLDELIRCYKSDEQNPCTAEWNDLRVNILKEALEANLYPILERMLLEVRQRKAKDRVGRLMQIELENQLRVPPYVYRSPDGTPETPKAIMALCYAEPSEVVVINQQGEVVSYKSINLSVPLSSNHINAAFKDNEARQLMSYLDEHRPDVIVIGAGGGLKCRTLKAQFERLVSACETEGILHRTIDVLLSDQSVAYKYSHSARSMQEFPRYPPTRLMAVSLARKLQDPLRELSGLCIGLSEDILSLHLHQLQGMLDKSERLKYTQRAFINVVNDVGVDINLAADKQIIFGNTLQFVAGLGPRKAQELLRIISQYGCVQYRNALLEDRNVRTVFQEVTFYNASAFMRITKNTSMWMDDLEVGQYRDHEENQAKWNEHGGGPLETTRIHPESYRFARKMISDALEEEDDWNLLVRALHPDRELHRQISEALWEQDLESYGKIIYQQTGERKTETLKDIRTEILNPFHDSRKLEQLDDGLLPWELDKRSEFNLLTGESDRRRPDGSKVSTLKDKVVHVRVFKLVRPHPRTDDPDAPPLPPYKVICKLENGLVGVLDEMNFGDTDADKRALQSRVKENDILSCMILEVKYEEFSVDLTYRESLIRKVEKVVKRDTNQNKKVGQIRSRMIDHPSFENVPRMKARRLLEEREAGEFIIRPSSQGLNLLSITRKVCDAPIGDDGAIISVYHEVQIKMFEQPSEFELGKRLQIENRTFENLDELIIGYLEVIASHEAKMMEHAKFCNASGAIIRNKLIEQKQTNGRGTPYLIGLNPDLQGGFMLFWLPGTKTVQEERITTVVDGFRFRQKVFKSPDHVINHFKQFPMELLNRSRGAQAPYAQPASTWGPPGGQWPANGSTWGPPPRMAPPPAGGGTWGPRPGGDWSGQGAGGQARMPPPSHGWNQRH
uniref:SH2 domain-containing protein n=1 Tax=Hanusia phi TaxID=3032 RepID=A0A7S0HS73_9CRYP|mmetsp:Transcript_33496/g.75165  ORF Transcript_33496/g.75165 Transcript_33496/m.75165 type:complete len:1585 (+) Transcript_33496:65-4819(+)